MTTQEAPATLKCRYRLATGCTAEYSADQKQRLYTHEKMNSAHALHRVTLTACPVCGKDFGGEPARAIHLSGVPPVGHGVTAGSERRQELDARQVKELYDAQYAAPDDTAAAVQAAALVLEATANVLTEHERTLLTAGPDEVPASPVSLNGHAPAALDLSAAQDFLAALLAEVEDLRAWKAAHEGDAVLVAEIGALYARRAAQD